MPSRWSISCKITRAANPSAATRYVTPSRSTALTVICVGRETLAVISGRLSHPSRPTSAPSAVSTIGLIIHVGPAASGTRGWSVQSM